MCRNAVKSQHAAPEHLFVRVDCVLSSFHPVLHSVSSPSLPPPAAPPPPKKNYNNNNKGVI